MQPLGSDTHEKSGTRTPGKKIIIQAGIVIAGIILTTEFMNRRMAITLKVIGHTPFPYRQRIMTIQLPTQLYTRLPLLFS
jgi:hypothetical protein